MADGLIYFLQSRTAIKIGFTHDLRSRLPKLQYSNGEQLKILAVLRGSQEIETTLHQQFAYYRVHGEWFELSKSGRRELLRYLRDQKKLGLLLTLQDIRKTMTVKQWDEFIQDEKSRILGQGTIPRNYDQWRYVLTKSDS